MPTTLYLDADACPVRAEAYKVAKRCGLPTVVVANTSLPVPAADGFSMVVCTGFGAADDWIAARAGPGDIVATADVPLAARCVAAGALVTDFKGRVWTAETIGEAVAVRDLMTELRQYQAVQAGGGPAPMTPRDRSRFLSTLDTLVTAARRVGPPGA